MYSPSQELTTFKPQWVGPSDTTADIIAEKLTDWKVEIVFGLVADHNNPLVQALNRKKGAIRYIAVHHERSAALMAASYARCTGNLGVCIATAGKTAEHLLDSLAGTARETAPLLAITSVTDYDTPRTPFMVFEQNITGPIHALTVVDLACRSALNTPGIAHITVTLDTQQRQVSEDQPSKRSSRNDVSIWPQYLAATISHLMKDDAILAADPAARMIFASHHWHTRTGHSLAIANSVSTPGLPFALSAQLAWPSRQCIALVNDNDAVTLMDEISTAVYYQLPVKVILIKDSLISIDFTRLASSYGMDTYSCKQPGELQSVIRQALASSSPALIEVELESSP